MNKLCAAFVGVCLAWGVSVCPAQSVGIPFRQIERDARIPDMVPEVALSRSNEVYLLPPGSSGSLYVQPRYKRHRILDSKYFLVNGLHLGLAALDVVLTQHCIANQHCREGNPIMPSSFAGQLAVDSALVGTGALVSYRLRNQDSKLWWLSPAIGASAHTAGAITGFLNR